MRFRFLAIIVFLLLLSASEALANQRTWGWCEAGNKAMTIGGLSPFPTTKWQQSYPACTVTVFLTGTLNLATIFSDNINTPLANPFTANSSGYWSYYAGNGHYDVKLSGGGITTPFTLGDILSNDAVSLGGISGTGTANTVAKFTGAFVLANSCIGDDGTTLAITCSVLKMPIGGTIGFSTDSCVSRINAGELGFGNCAPADLSGTATAATFKFSGDATTQTTAANIAGGTNILQKGNGLNKTLNSSVTDTNGTTNILLTTDSVVQMATAGTLCWSTDTCFSRHAGGIVRLGSGAFDDRTGTLGLTTLNFPDATNQITAFIAPLATSQGGTGVTDFTFSGNTHKAVTLSGAATASRCLHTDAAGNAVVAAADCVAAAGMTNPMTTTGDTIYSSDNAGTPARLAIGTVGLPLAASSAGLPAWGNPGHITQINTNTAFARANLYTAAPGGLYTFHGSLVSNGGCPAGQAQVNAYFFWTSDAGIAPAFPNYNGFGNFALCNNSIGVAAAVGDGCAGELFDNGVKNATDIQYQVFYSGCSSGAYTCPGFAQTCTTLGTVTCTGAGVPTCGGGDTPTCSKLTVSNNNPPGDGFGYSPTCQTGSLGSYSLKLGVQRIF